MMFSGVYTRMKISLTQNQFLNLVVIVLLLSVSSPLFAVNSVATVNVKVSRFLSMTNTGPMNFGEVSINSVAGTVVLNSDGSRDTTGGVKVSGSSSYSLAKFVIEGAQNADYSVSFPDEVVMTDGYGNTLIVDHISSELFDAGRSGSNGLKELVLGAQLNLESYQATGSYKGTLVVEVEYR